MHGSQSPDELATEGLRIARRLAFRLRRRLPAAVSVSIDDLVSAASLGVLHAVRSFDASRGVPFAVFASRRIWGEMLDELRRIDWVPRLLRERMVWLALVRSQLRGELGRVPTADEVAQAAGCREDDPGMRQADVESLDRRLGESEESGRELNARQLIADPRQHDPSCNVELADELATWGIADRVQVALLMYHLGGYTMKEIGVRISLTESRVSQLLAEATIRLQGRYKRKVS